MTTFSEPNMTKVFINLQGNNSKMDNNNSIPVIYNHSQRYAEQKLMESIKIVFPEYDDKTYDIYHDNGAELDISRVLEGDTLLLIPNVEVDNDAYGQKYNQDTPTINNINDTDTIEGKNGGNLLRQGSSMSDGITHEDSTDYTSHNTAASSDEDDLIVASDVTPMSNGLNGPNSVDQSNSLSITDDQGNDLATTNRSTGNSTQNTSATSTTSTTSTNRYARKQKWNCSACTMENDAYAYSCNMCNTSKPLHTTTTTTSSNHTPTSQPNLGPMEHISKKYAEFEKGDNEGLKNKICALGQTYGAFRSIRGDGNCYYRAIVISLFSKIFDARHWSTSKNQTMLRNLIDKIEDCPFILQEDKRARTTMIDFLNKLQNIANGGTDDGDTTHLPNNNNNR